jgi:hypothetical protein
MHTSLREETMSLSTDHFSARVQPAFVAETARPSWKFWPSIVGIAVLEIVVLLALAGVFVAYLNWSSEASFAEFLAASEAAQPAPRLPLNKVQLPCKKGT